MGLSTRTLENAHDKPSGDYIGAVYFHDENTCTGHQHVHRVRIVGFSHGAGKATLDFQEDDGHTVCVSITRELLRATLATIDAACAQEAVES